MPFIYSWNANSETAKQLGQFLGYRRIRHENSSFVGGLHKVVVNYGSSSLPTEVERSTVIQPPEAVATNSHKLRFFRHMSEGDDCPRLPEWTTEMSMVRQWLLDEKAVMARTVLQGHSGEGIVIMHLGNPQEYVTDSPLYTLYIKKKDEYRVHFVDGQIIDYTKKALSSEVPRDNLPDDFYMVRNHAKGFIYMREGVELPDDVERQATLAFRKSGLDYGAVDVIYNQRQNQAYVLEINTAPGMEGTTLRNYANAIRTLVGERANG